MQIPLNQFENYIDESILKRGLSYFKKGLVQDLENISPNEYEATICGTEDYTVHLTIKNDVITESVCDCPYDMGPVCKHIAAVIFELQKDALDLKTGTKKRPNPNNQRQKKPKLLLNKLQICSKRFRTKNSKILFQNRQKKIKFSEIF